MRVISGSAGRLQLKTIDGLDTRPTTDRIKETLFNMIQSSITDCFFLDLYSGSGAIGIEALSRGAEKAVMIENNPKAVSCIKENLTLTHLEKNAYVMPCEALAGLRQLEDKDIIFDLVFMDPPYNQGHEHKVLEYLSRSKLIDENTIIIVEASKETGFPYLEALGFQVEKCKDYKTNKHMFIKITEQAADGTDS